MRLSAESGLPTYTGSDQYQKTLSFKLFQTLRNIVQQLNNLSEGKLTAKTNAATAAPTSGTWAQGDEVYNSAPTELGSGGSKYIIDKWKCVASGTPGTWVACRTLTGN